MQRAVSPSGRKYFLCRVILGAAMLGALWWWTLPPPDPIGPHWRLSEFLQDWAPGQSYSPETTGDLHALGPAGVKWLTHTLEHGRQPFTRRGPLPFDRAPQWLRVRIPDRWGGLGVSALFDERAAAMDLLEVFGPQAAPAIPALVRSLDRGNDDWVQAVLVTLHKIGPASWPAVQKALAHPDPHIRSVIVKSLAQRIVHSSDAAYVPPKAEVIEVAQALIRALGDPNPDVRAAAAYAISGCRNQRFDSLDFFDPALPILIQLLSDPGPVRHVAISGLTSFRAKAAPAIPALAPFLHDDDLSIRIGAAAALHMIGPASWPVVEEALATGPAPARWSILVTMPMRLEPGYGPSVPDSELTHIADTLIKSLHDPDRQVQRGAIEALLRCQGNRRDSAIFDPAVPQLLTFLTEDDPNVPDAAFQTLRNFGTHAKQTVSHLIQLLDHDNPAIRCNTAAVLGDVDIEEQSSAERLRTMLQDPIENCQKAADDALQNFDRYNARIAEKKTGAANSETPSPSR
jgi:HEAT repeat protein